MICDYGILLAFCKENYIVSAMTIRDLSLSP